MKKLMIMAAVAIAAVAANAGSVTWSVSGIKSVTDSTVAFSGSGMAYFFASTVSATDVEDAIKGGTFDKDYASQATKSKVLTGATVTQPSVLTGVSGEMTFYTVLLDATTGASAKNYIVTSSVTQTVPSTAAAKVFAFTAPTTWTAVPEPTSGLLLLLGVAGLALRRKQK